MRSLTNKQTEEYATAVGYALHSWSGVEVALALLFEQLSGILPTHKANAAFFAIISFETRLDVCHALMAFSGEDEEELEIWNKLYARLRSYYKKRHRLAHFSIVHSMTPTSTGVKTTASLVPFWPAQSPKKGGLSLADIADRTQKFTDLEDAVSWFWRRASKRAIGEVSPRQEPDLVRQLRSLVVQSREEPPHPPQSSEA